MTIGKIGDLIAALESSQPRMRMAILQAIGSQPHKASALAEKGGVDLFAELTTRAAIPDEERIRPYYIKALLGIDDDRAFKLAKNEFLSTANPDIVLLTGEKLAAMSEAERADFFSPVILQSHNPNKRRVAANLLAYCRNLSVAVAIRTAVISDHPVTPPALTKMITFLSINNYNN